MDRQAHHQDERNFGETGVKGISVIIIFLGENLIMNRFFIAFLAVALLLPAYSWALDYTESPEAVAVMDEVVVTATKTEEKRRDIVNAVVVKDAADIAEAPAESLGSFIMLPAKP